MKEKIECTWRVTDIKSEAQDVISLYLESESEKPSYKAGQFMTVKIPNLLPSEGKPYSISNAPHEDKVRITVRKIGQFSSAFFGLSVNDIITTSLPYGYFYPESEDTNDLVFIAGGIGITPCISNIKNLTHTNSQRNIHLFYSNQTESDIVFKDELDTLAKINSRLFIHHHITREEPKNKEFISRRISPDDIPEFVTEPKLSDFFLCGSINFTKSLWKGLNEIGIPQDRLYTEGFF